MPVKQDPSGRRYVSSEAEVPGTPEQVWQAIASGPGFTSWFVPTRMEQREGGAISMNFGPGMDSASTIVQWDPPHRYVAESGDMGPDAPTVATEWTVEARSGGTCLVRVVHSWFAATDQWDDHYASTEHGWVAFFRILRLYLAHFAGRSCTQMQVAAGAAGPPHEAWRSLAAPLGLAEAAPGARVASTDGAPPLAGVVEHAGPAAFPDALLRLDAPAPGLAHLFAMPMGGRVYLSIRLFLYGADAATTAAREEPRWQAWLAERFPADAPAVGG